MKTTLLSVGRGKAVAAAGAGAVVTLVIAALVVSGCGRPSEAGSGEPVIVATIYPLANLIEQIVGDRARVECIVPPGVSPHGFDPTARHADAFSRADVIVMVGLRYDDWAEQWKDRYGRDDATLLNFAAMVGRQEGGAHAHHHDEHDHEHDHGHDHAHEHAGGNPHLWLDPVLTRRFVARLGLELAHHLGDGDGELAGRTAALIEDLESLDREFAEALSPHAGAKVITFHNAFDLMVERYGLEMAATLTPVEAPGALTSGRVERALGVIREHGVGTVFAEPQFPPDAGRVLEQEAGVKVLMLDPLGDPHDPGRDSYQKLMRGNLKALVEGVGEAP